MFPNNGHNNGGPHLNWHNLQYIQRIVNLGGNQNQIDSYIQMVQLAQIQHYEFEANYLSNRAQVILNWATAHAHQQQIESIYTQFTNVYMLMHQFHEPQVRNQCRSIIQILIGKLNVFNIGPQINPQGLRILAFAGLEANLASPIINLNLIHQVHHVFFPNNNPY